MPACNTMLVTGIQRLRTYALPLTMLVVFLIYWVYSGFTANNKIVWIADAAFNLLLLLFLFITFKKHRLSRLSYLLIFLFLILAQIGIRYNYELVPYNEWTMFLFGFHLNDMLGFERDHYDRFVHFCFGLLIYFPVFEVLKDVAGIQHVGWRHFFAFSIINAASAIYEVIEYAGGMVIVGESYLVYQGMQGDMLDPSKDIAMALLGAVFAIAIIMLHNSRRKKAIIGLTLPLMLFASATKASDYDSDIILEKAFQRYDANDMYTVMSMEVVRPQWNSEISFLAWTKTDYLALVAITGPARERGQSFLKRGGELWHYIPTIERTVKMSGVLLAQSWMGSDFSIEDVLQTRSFASHYTSRLIGQKMLDGNPCYHIELTPKPGTAVVWGKVHAWITTAGYNQIRVEFFDQQGLLVQVMEASEFKSWQGRSLPSHIQMTPLAKPGNKTILHVNQYVFDQDLDDGFFSLQQMRKIR